MCDNAIEALQTCDWIVDHGALKPIVEAIVSSRGETAVTRGITACDG